jgi:hypothetical protein
MDDVATKYHRGLASGVSNDTLGRSDRVTLLTSQAP